MKYYKIIQDNNFIGVCCSTNFVRYQKKNQFYMGSDETRGEFVQCQGKLYRSTWMPPVPNEATHPFEQAIIIEINREEYDRYKIAIENNEQIIEEEEPIITIPRVVIEDPTNEVSINFMRDSKIKEMSMACNKIIEQGFDLTLRNESHHFSLTTQDQLNLMSLGIMAQTESLIPYHADGEECIFYTNDEINEIVETANSFKIYHTTYYNALKNYINTLETIEDISAIEYGIEIPEEYKTDVLKALEQ